MSPKNLTKLAIISALTCFMAAANAAISPAIQSAKDSAEKALQDLDGRWVSSGGIEIITGGPSTAAAQSRWGHISIRFVGSGQTSIEDTSVEAMALNPPTDSAGKVAINGIDGGYPIVLMFGSLGKLIQSYYFTQTRGYTRTIIPSTPELRRSLLETLRSVNRIRTGTDRYYFFANNCASYMSRILDYSGFRQIAQPTPFIPTQTSLHFRRSLISPWPDVEGISAAALQSYANMKQIQFSSLSTLDLQRLMVFRGLDLGQSAEQLISQLATRSDKQSTDKVYGIEALPNAFYQMDATISSKDAVSQAFTKAQIQSASLYNRSALSSVYSGTLCSTSPGQCKYFEQAQLLIETQAN